MDNVELIERIDQKLADSVDATRNAHAQIQQILLMFKSEAQAEQQKHEPKLEKTINDNKS